MRSLLDFHVTHPKAVLALSSVLLTAGIVLGVIGPWGGIGWDFANFYNAGVKVASGQVGDLYELGSTTDSSRLITTHSEFVGAPLSAFFCVPLALMPPNISTVVFKIQNTIAILVGVTLLHFHLRRLVTIEPGDTLALLTLWTVLLVAFQPFWSVYRVGGQLTATVFLLFVLVLIWHTNGRLTLSAIAMVLIVVLKPAFLPALVWLALGSGLPYVLRLTAAGTGAASLSVLTLGFDIHVKFVLQVLEWGGTLQPWPMNSAVTVTFDNLLLHGGLAAVDELRWARLVTRLVVGVFLVWLGWRSRSMPWRPAARRHFHVLMASMFSLLVCPVVWEHYLTILFLPLTYFVTVGSQLSRSAAWLVMAIFAFASTQNVSVSMFLDNALPVDNWAALVFMGIFKSMVLLLVLAFLSRCWREFFSTYSDSRWNSIPV